MGTRNRIPCAWLKQVGDRPAGAEGRRARRELSRVDSHLSQPILAQPILAGYSPDQLHNTFDVDVWTFGLAVALKF